MRGRKSERTSARMICFGSARTDGVRLEACTRRITGFELAVEDNGGIGEFLSWQAELGAKEDLGWAVPGESHQAHAFFEVAVAGQDAECAQHPVNARLLFLPSDLVAYVLPNLRRCPASRRGGSFLRTGL